METALPGCRPISDQEDLEQEANAWAALWKETATYDAACDALGADALPLIRLEQLLAAALSFPPAHGAWRG